MQIELRFVIAIYLGEFACAQILGRISGGFKFLPEFSLLLPFMYFLVHFFCFLFFQHFLEVLK